MRAEVGRNEVEGNLTLVTLELFRSEACMMVRTSGIVGSWIISPNASMEILRLSHWNVAGSV